MEQGRNGRSISDHIRSNVVGYVAIFFVFASGAYAVDGRLDGKNSVGSADILNGQVKSGDIGKNQVKSADIGKGQVKSGDIGNGKVTSADIGDGQVVGADLDETSLDSSVVQRRVNGSCAAGQAIRSVAADGTVACEPDDEGGGPPTGAAGGDLAGTYPNPTIASGAVGGGTGGEISDNTVTDADLAAPAQFTGAVADGDLDGTYPNPEIETDAVGSNEVALNSLTVDDLGPNSVGTSEVDGTLQGADIQDHLRSISLPLTSFIECQTDAGAFLNFASGGADAFPDFSNSATDGEGFTIRFDADLGNEDQGTEICSQLMVPTDHALSGSFRIRWSRDADTPGGVERIECNVSVNGGGLETAGLVTLPPGTSGVSTCTPTISPPLEIDDSLSLYLSVVPPTGGTINDPVDFHSVELIYTADQ